MSITQRIRIQRKIITLVKEGEFYRVTYDRNTGLPEDIVREESRRVSPTSVLVNEIASQFTVDEEYGRDYRLKRSQWVFEVLVEFSREVTMEFWEEAMLDLPILEADEEHGLPQVMLVLKRNGVIHPVQQNASTGTLAKVVLEAVVGRI